MSSIFGFRPTPPVELSPVTVAPTVATSLASPIAAVVSDAPLSLDSLSEASRSYSESIDGIRALVERLESEKAVAIKLAQENLQQALQFLDQVKELSDRNSELKGENSVLKATVERKDAQIADIAKIHEEHIAGLNSAHKEQVAGLIKLGDERVASAVRIKDDQIRRLEQIWKSQA